MEYNAQVWAIVSKTIIKTFDGLQQRVKLLINDTKVSICIDSLEHHCNVVCVSLFHLNFNEMYAREIKGSVSKNHMI